jgi:hypothetical protein
MLWITLKYKLRGLYVLKYTDVLICEIDFFLIMQWDSDITSKYFSKHLLVHAITLGGSTTMRLTADKS